MKRILFLFIASLFLLACSNDDTTAPEEQNTDLKIKKYTSISFDENGDTNGQMIEYFFDENGKKTKDHIVDAFIDYVWQYNYNDLGQVTKKSRNHVNYPVDIVEEYFYDSENKLEKLYVDSNNDGVVEDSLILSYQPNKIIARWHTPGHESKELSYNNEDVLTSVKHLEDLGININEVFSYDSSSNIILINLNTDFFNSESTYSYEYDGKANPFYKEYHDFYFNIAWRAGGHLFKNHLFFSPSNVAKTTRTGNDPSENFIIETSYTYNSENYPVSSETKLDGTLTSQETYEYY